MDAALRHHADGTAAHRVTIALGPLAEDLPLGASVAVNGVCLTVADLAGESGSFDVVPETWQATALKGLRPRTPVNLERSLQVGDRIDGHFVQGHVDGVGTVAQIERTAGEWKLWVRAAAEILTYVVPKGSIAVDGTSLTIVDYLSDRFSVALIPTTLDETVLGRRQPGDEVNLETDILARIIVRRLDALRAAGGITVDQLREGGFV